MLPRIKAVGRSGLAVWLPVADEPGITSALLDRGWAVAPGERSDPDLTSYPCARPVRDLSSSAGGGLEVLAGPAAGRRRLSRVGYCTELTVMPAPRHRGGQNPQGIGGRGGPEIGGS